MPAPIGLPFLAGRLDILPAMAIDASQLMDAFQDNADYAEAGSCAKARAFETAVLRMMGLPKSAAHGTEEISFDPATLRTLWNDVKAWIADNCPEIPVTDGTGSTVAGGAVHYDLSDFRR